MLVVLSVVALILFSGRTMAKDSDAVAGGTMVRLTRRIAWLYVAICGVGALVATAETLWDAAVTVRLPVAEFWPKLPETVTIQTPLATVESGGFAWANVSVSGLDVQARLMLTGAVLAQAALAVVAGLVIIKLCTAVMNKTLFAPRLTKGVQQVAGVVLVGGLVWQGCQIFGGTMAAEQVLGATAWGQAGETIAWTDIHTMVGLPSVAYSWEFNFWPVGVALVLMVLAELFRQGSKVQQGATGLV
ncbi:hypothetical protein AL755_19220 [Arthrobacter sp. ERGS1:01]|nr:hypothetical protein AL755_19220 [Arthrobacter sp. ERGS1:01]